MLRKALLACAVSAMIVPAVANAGFVINGGTAGQIGDFGAPGHDSKIDNDVVISEFGVGTVLDGFFGANISIDQDTSLNFEFIGKEAGYTTTFSFAGNSFTNNDAKGTSFNVMNLLASAVLDFRFDVTESGAFVVNGSNNDSITGGFADFWVMQELDGSLLIAFDDGGANPDDDNHDDMVIRISQVPEPGTLGLIGLGLVAAGAARRKTA